MIRDDDILYHSGRVAAELDLARKAASVPAARAHLALSELHLERLRVLGAGAADSGRRPPDRHARAAESRF
jgi:hypothetical protein